MGVVKKILGSVVGGAQKPKSSPAPAAVAAPAPKESAAEVVAREEEDRRKRLLALNAGGPAGQMTPAGGVQGAANVTRKALLGQ